jgi:hypothetical protein
MTLDRAPSPAEMAYRIGLESDGHQRGQLDSVSYCRGIEDERRRMVRWLKAMATESVKNDGLVNVVVAMYFEQMATSLEASV